MPELIIASALTSLVVGAIVMFILRLTHTYEQITLLEFAIGAVVIVILIAPITGCAGWNAAKANAKQYNEYWNGWETAARDDHVECSKDGGCKFEYPCDPYEVCDSYDDKGRCTSSHTAYHSCPYFTYERALSIDTTLGNYGVARLAPPNYRDKSVWWDRNERPETLSLNQLTEPQEWLDCRDRIAAGRPGPVTKRMTYDNYLLAADAKILKQYSSDIDVLLKQKLLPKLQHDTRDRYFADKAYFVGYQPTDVAVWQSAVAYLNAGFGTELQGDLHLVVVKNDVLPVNPDAYLFALKAYWQDPGKWGKNALSKNTVIVVVGTDDGTTVKWARALTGMPLGNEYMLTIINRDLEGKLLTPDAFVGSVQGEFYQDTKDGKTKTKVRSLHDGGALERILWGIDNPLTKFVRVSMTARDANDVGRGFGYLDTQIEPTTGQKWAIWFGIVFLSGIVWVVFAIVNVRGKETYRTYRSYRSGKNW